MGKLDLNPKRILGILVAVGLLLNLLILATGSAAEEDALPPPAADPRAQQKRIDDLKVEIADLLGSNFPTGEEAQQNTFDLFAFAERYGVELRSLSNDRPEAEKLARMSFEKVVSNVEFRGTRTNVINMLLNIDEVVRNTALLSNVDVKGTTESWNIQFALTQYHQ